jgi:hypothetical protein
MVYTLILAEWKDFTKSAADAHGTSTQTEDNSVDAVQAIQPDEISASLADVDPPVDSNEPLTIRTDSSTSAVWTTVQAVVRLLKVLTIFSRR